jgi:hypothetical protein
MIINSIKLGVKNGLVKTKPAVLVALRLAAGTGTEPRTFGLRD